MARLYFGATDTILNLNSKTQIGVANDDAFAAKKGSGNSAQEGSRWGVAEVPVEGVASSRNTAGASHSVRRARDESGERVGYPPVEMSRFASVSSIGRTLEAPPPPPPPGLFWRKLSGVK